ncbi:MAG: toxin-antitoxin system YwqK family antitoxin [Kofleriaceae bacterium]
MTPRTDEPRTPRRRLTRAPAWGAIVAMTRTTLALSILLVAGCTKHNGTPTTPHGNDLLLSREGIASHGGGGVHRCPSRNGEGDIKLNFASGNKRVKGTCKGGVMVGDWTAWYDNGAVVWEASFKDGLLHGDFTSYWANDQKRAEVEYANGVPHGDFEAWYFNGEKMAEGKYLAGKRNGCWETWHDNGEKATKGTYSDDRQVLTWLKWTPGGDKLASGDGRRRNNRRCLVVLRKPLVRRRLIGAPDVDHADRTVARSRSARPASSADRAEGDSRPVREASMILATSGWSGEVETTAPSGGGRFAWRSIPPVTAGSSTDDRRRVPARVRRLGAIRTVAAGVAASDERLHVARQRSGSAARRAAPSTVRGRRRAAGRGTPACAPAASAGAVIHSPGVRPRAAGSGAMEDGLEVQAIDAAVAR